MKKTSSASKLFMRFAITIMALCLIAGMSIPTVFAAQNDAVIAAKKGVLQFNLAIQLDNSKEATIIKQGSCFLINSNTIVTCAHCAEFTEEELALVSERFGLSAAQINDRIVYTVTVYRDLTKKCNLIIKSSVMDFAVFSLTESLTNKPLSLRRSSEVKQTEDVYAIGFPQLTEAFQAVSTYISDDATVTSGQVNLVTYGANLYSGEMNEFIQTTCVLTSGNSGGPMVDKDGNVVGICQGAFGEEGQYSYYIAVAIDQVITACEAYQISFDVKSGQTEPDTSKSDTSKDDTSKGDESKDPGTPVVSIPLDYSSLDTKISKADSISKDSYTNDSYSKMTSALENARMVRSSAATQSEVDRASSNLQNAIDNLTKEKEDNKMMIIIIAAAAAVVIIIIIIVIVSSKGKKNKAALASTPAARYTPPTPPTGGTPMGGFPTSGPPAGGTPGVYGTNPPRPTPGGFTPAGEKSPYGDKPAIPVNNAGETTILNQGAGETTLLSKNIDGGVLVRRKTGDRIPINTSDFVIGREKNKVNFCISDNSSISRAHVKFVVRDGYTYLVDMNAANGTFVNGIKANRNEEVTLKSGDKVTLANEDFEFIK